MDQKYFVEWQPDFSVGNDELDEQHKKLLGLCKMAVSCMADESPEGTLLFHDILNELSGYVRTHFRTEEALMKACGYPLLAQHQREHDKYHDRLTELLVKAGRGDINRDGLHHYLSNWWSNHILGSDKQYVESIKGH